MVIQTKKYTVAEFQEIEALPENADKTLELIAGEIVEKVASFTPSKISSRIIYHFTGYLIERPIGYVTGEAGGYIMSGEDTYNPDVGYISKERLPEEPPREAPVPPDLAVEVKSPTDSKRKMRLKAEKYLAYGTNIVWLIFPKERMVEVYKSGEEDVENIGIDGTLDGGDILPGFTLKVRDIFPE